MYGDKTYQEIFDELHKTAREVSTKEIPFTLGTQVMLVAALAHLVRRVRALEVQGTLSYEGTFSEKRSYSKGMAVTHGGSLWIAKRRTEKRPPGDGNEDWQLAVKRGRDGRDGRT